MLVAECVVLACSDSANPATYSSGTKAVTSSVCVRVVIAQGCRLLGRGEHRLRVVFNAFVSSPDHGHDITRPFPLATPASVISACTNRCRRGDLSRAVIALACLLLQHQPFNIAEREHTPNTCDTPLLAPTTPDRTSIPIQVSHRRSARASSLWQSPCIFATLAKTYRDFSLDYAVQEHQGEGHSANVDIQHGIHQYGLPAHTNPFLQPAVPAHHQPLHHQHAGHPQLLQVSGIEAHPSLHQAHMLRQMPQHQPQSPYTTASHLDYAPRGRKRSREYELRLDLQGLHGLSGDEGPGEVPVSLTPHGYHSHGASMHYQTAPGPPPHHLPLPPPPQQHHHHRLPNQAPPHKLHRGSYGEPSPPLTSHGPPSVVGQEGMPAPAPRPRGPKLKFTPEDDQLLVDLKEKKNLTWKQIAEFFPGRSSGTLQVRYCTKLKAKTTVWTDEMVQKLRNAIQEYENDKWRIISAKVGSGFSPAACRDKVAELSGEAILPDDAEDVSFSHAEMIPSSSSDPGVPFQ